MFQQCSAQHPHFCASCDSSVPHDECSLHDSAYSTRDDSSTSSCCGNCCTTFISLHCNCWVAAGYSMHNSVVRQGLLGCIATYNSGSVNCWFLVWKSRSKLVKGKHCERTAKYFLNILGTSIMTRAVKVLPGITKKGTMLPGRSRVSSEVATLCWLQLWIMFGRSASK